MSDERRALVEYRLARARESLLEADALAERNYWNTAVSRLYYACFYAIGAALLARGLASPKHSGVRALFNRELVRTGLVSADLGQLYNDLFRHRQRSDYEDFVRFEEGQVRPWLTQAREFVAALEPLAQPQHDTG